MSLRQLCQENTFTVERGVGSQNNGAGWTKSYNTTNRGSLPRSFHGRDVTMSAKDSVEYGVRQMDRGHVIFVEEFDPKLDERDRLINNEVSESRPAGDPIPYLYVTGVINPDQRNRFWKIVCAEVLGEPR